MQKELSALIEPFHAYNFFVEIEGMFAGGFSEVRGLEMNTEVEKVYEGGVNGSCYKLPKTTSSSDLVFSSGVTYLDSMLTWYQSCSEGKITRKNGSVFILDSVGLPLYWWNFFGAWPRHWQGPQFNASQNLVATETFTLAHNGIKLHKLSAAEKLMGMAANALV